MIIKTLLGGVTFLGLAFRMFWRIWKIFGREQLRLVPLIDIFVKISTAKDNFFYYVKLHPVQAWRGSCGLQEVKAHTISRQRPHEVGKFVRIYKRVIL